MAETVIGGAFLVVIGGWAVLASVYGVAYAVRDAVRRVMRKESGG